jgi:hypothetical protein
MYLTFKHLESAPGGEPWNAPSRTRTCDQRIVSAEDRLEFPNENAQVELLRSYSLPSPRIARGNGLHTMT